MLKQTPGRFLLSCLVIISSLAATAVAFRGHFTVGVQPDGRIVVPNGQLLTPAGTHIEVNDRPLGMVLSPDRRTLAVVTGSNFNPRALHLIDVDIADAQADDQHLEQLRRRRVQSGRRHDLRRRRREQRREDLHRGRERHVRRRRDRFRSPAPSRAVCR